MHRNSDKLWNISFTKRGREGWNFPHIVMCLRDFNWCSLHHLGLRPIEFCTLFWSILKHFIMNCLLSTSCRQFPTALFMSQFLHYIIWDKSLSCVKLLIYNISKDDLFSFHFLKDLWKVLKSLCWRLRPKVLYLISDLLIVWGWHGVILASTWFLCYLIAQGFQIANTRSQNPHPEFSTLTSHIQHFQLLVIKSPQGKIWDSV